jgi:calcineurin-like phosphoesterase family protein
MIYFTADTHFCHSNIIRMCGRPYPDIDAMNTALIENWNSRVTARDEIYILGDLVFRGEGKEANEILGQLRGKKYLIKGNHEKYLDDPKFNAGVFEWVKDYHVFKHEKRLFVLFHYPIFEWAGYYHSSIHLYGHIHNDKERINYMLNRGAVNVGVDVWDYRPVSMAEIMKAADKGRQIETERSGIPGPGELVVSLDTTSRGGVPPELP